jgi:hypothetical protein
MLCRFHLAGSRTWPGVAGMSASAPAYKLPDGRIMRINAYARDHRATCPLYQGRRADICRRADGSWAAYPAPVPDPPCGCGCADGAEYDTWGADN